MYCGRGASGRAAGRGAFSDGDGFSEKLMDGPPAYLHKTEERATLWRLRLFDLVLLAEKLAREVAKLR